YSLLEVAGALDGEHAAMAGAVLVGRIDQLDGCHHPRPFFIIDDLDFENVQHGKIEGVVATGFGGAHKATPPLPPSTASSSANVATSISTRFPTVTRASAQ